MQNFFTSFSYPYQVFYDTAKYSFVQNIELVTGGERLESIYFFVHCAFKSYAFLFVVTPILNMLASFSLSRRLGVLICIMWCVPGCLYLIGVINPTVDVPDTYFMGIGLKYVGEYRSTLFNVFLMLVFGWSFFTLVVHSFKIGKHFKDAYDHIWYLMGLAAIVIFVVDSNAAFYRDELNNTNAEISQSIALTLNQLHFAKRECLSNHENLLAQGISFKFCPAIDRLIGHYSFMSETKDDGRQYREKAEIEQLIPAYLEADIEKFNHYQCELRHAPECGSVAFDLVNHSVTFDFDKGYALAIYHLNKTLAVTWDYAAKMHEKLNASRKNPNMRWFFYLLIGFVVGGKISNASRAIAGPPKALFRYWLSSLLKSLKRWMNLTVAGVIWSGRYVKSLSGPG